MNRGDTIGGCRDIGLISDRYPIGYQSGRVSVAADTLSLAAADARVV